MQYIILLLKGFIIGVAKIIPGLSGAMLAISLGVYEKSLKAISSFFKDIKNNLKLLVPLGIGVVISIILASKIVVYFLDNYYLPTILLFVGLITGGIPILLKKVNFNKLRKIDYLVFILSFGFVFLLTLVGKQDIFVNYNNSIMGFILFFLVGVLDAVTMIIPGISGTAVMMIVGCYNLLLTALSSLTSLDQIMSNLHILIPFVSGLIVGVISLAKIMNYLLEKKEQATYSAIIGFALSSVLSLLISTFGGNYNIFEIIIGLILLVLGFIASKKMEG